MFGKATMFGKTTATLLLGVYGGVYCDQNFQVMEVSSPKEIYCKGKNCCLRGYQMYKRHFRKEKSRDVEDETH